MRKTILAVFCLIAVIKINAQVVFCPPGAEWHYTFVDWDRIENESITYVSDSIAGPDTIKILHHSKFFKQCNVNWISPTFIKQKGDTVFFRNNRTQSTWQILYNYAALPGQSWRTSIGYGSNYNSTITYTIMVDSVKTENINSFLLKELFVKYIHISGFSTVTVDARIMERLGCGEFLFNYENNNCDAPHFGEFLCYQDNFFGIKQFTSKPCDYSNLAGISESNINNLKIYPNPVSEILNIDLQSAGATSYQIKVVNLLGEEVHAGIRSNESRIELDIQELKKGIYFLQIFNKDKLIANEKIIKD